MMAIHNLNTKRMVISYIYIKIFQIMVVNDNVAKNLKFPADVKLRKHDPGNY